jgi:hypothetical protein
MNKIKETNEEISITFLFEPVFKKPETDEEKCEWSKAVATAPTIEATVEEIAWLVGATNHSFCHCVFRNGWINSDNFEFSQLIVLDIDNKNKKDNEYLFPNQAINRCKELDLPTPNFIYRTLSDLTDDNLPVEEKLKLVKRYRMVFVLDKPIYDLTKYEAFVKQGMYIIFPESDHVGVTQKWLGGKELIHLDVGTRLNLMNLMCVADLYDACNVGTSQGRKKRFKKKYDKLPPDIFHNVLVVVSKNANSLSIYKELEKNETIRNFDWARGRMEFPLLDDFLGCKRKIHNPELMGLFSAMRRIEGGRLEWKRAIRNNPLINNRHLTIADWFNKVIDKGDNPWEQLISEYAPDDPTASKYDRLTDIHFKRGKKAIKLKNIPEISLKEAYMKMEKFIKEFLDSKDKKFAVCKAATALGKSRFLLENVQKGCLVCVPTHKLACEHATQLRASGIEFLIAPDVPDLPDPIKKEWEQMQKIGDHKCAAKFLKRMSNNLNACDYRVSGKETIKLQRSLTKYFDELKQCTESSLPVITTHKRLLFTEYPNHHTVIIDEDIITNLFETGSFTTKDLRLLINSVEYSNYPGHDKDLAVLEGLLKDINTKSQLFRHIQSTSNGKAEIYEDFKKIKNRLHQLGNKLEGKILPFFNCSHYIVDFEDENDVNGEKVVHYQIKHQLPTNKKTIVLSATANEFIYRKIFGDIEWIDLAHVEHKGNRVQFSDLSHSRSTIASKNNRKSLNLVNDFTAHMHKITFKKYRYLFNEPNNIYFGNCSGVDEYKGQDIAVVGTPHVPTFVYRLMAAALGIEFTEDDFKLEQQWVEYNGYKFYFMTFAHQGLRNIQFYYIESELIQACGRNRSLREDATVFLFSSFPIAGFKQYSTKELDKLDPIDFKIHQEKNVIPLSMPSGSLAS